MALQQSASVCRGLRCELLCGVMGTFFNASLHRAQKIRSIAAGLSKHRLLSIAFHAPPRLKRHERLWVPPAGETRRRRTRGWAIAACSLVCVTWALQVAALSAYTVNVCQPYDGAFRPFAYTDITQVVPAITAAATIVSTTNASGATVIGRQVRGGKHSRGNCSRILTPLPSQKRFLREQLCM